MGLNPQENYYREIKVAIVSSYQVEVVLNLQLDEMKKKGAVRFSN